MIPRLHVITDTTLQDRYSHIDIARIASASGAGVIQYREKRERNIDLHIAEATAMKNAMDPAAMFIVNDSMKVAKRVSADGIHVGLSDDAPSLVRDHLGEGVLIGATANSLEQALDARNDAADYLGIGPVFGTKTKKSPSKTLGIEGFREIVEQVSKPCIAIGSITKHNTKQVLDAGAHGIAVVSAVVLSNDLAKEVEVFAKLCISP